MKFNTGYANWATECKRKL